MPLKSKMFSSLIVLEAESDTSFIKAFSFSFPSLFPSYKAVSFCQKHRCFIFSLYLQLRPDHMENRGGDSKKQPSAKKKSILVGPWGGNGGSSWDDGINHGVREITLVYDRCIDSIEVVYDKNGKPVKANKHGGVGGSKTAEIKLQFPEEILVSVSGHYCPVVYGGSPVIRSLTLKTNRSTFGPYGVEEGTPFTVSMDGGTIVGFKGRSGWYLDAIGFHISRVQSNNKLIQKVQRKLQSLTSTVAKSVFTPKEVEIDVDVVKRV